MASTSKKAGGGRRELILLLLAAVMLTATLGSYFYTEQAATRDREWLTLARSLQTQITELGKVGDSAARGLAPDFRALEGAQANVNDVLLILQEGDEFIELPPPPATATEALVKVEDAWLPTNESVETILDARGAFNSTDRTLYELRRQAGAAQEQARAEQDALRQSAANTARLLAYSRVQVSLEILRAEALRIIGAGRDADKTIAGMNNTLKQLLDDMARSGTAADSDLSTSVKAVESALRSLSRLARKLTEVQAATASLSQQGTAVTSAAIEVEDALTEYSQARPIKAEYVYYFGGATIVFLALFVVFFLYSARRRSVLAERSEKAQQEAILRLLDEIADLADGDLTNMATVSEDFTGAIADSINFTIETLRTLVGTIQTSSSQVSAAADATLERTDSLNKASQEQTERVNAAAESIERMNQGMQAMSEEAQQLSRQSDLSLETARTGGETVRRSIESMEALREQIQDTSKRIKRLGESSQEIGNIIEFINDIAEQTNTLALNAAIQAAMAGEAGRGFAVVADEVQRLAERAADATRQIEGLVKTIQADTNEAIVSMERSTTNVVTGASSAEEAGQALEKVENFANELAKVVTRITSETAQQLDSTRSIAQTMEAVRTLANQTSSTADETASSTRQLSALSGQLRESVSGFRLPGESEGDDDADLDMAESEAA